MLIIAIIIKLSDGGEIFVGTPVRLRSRGKEFFMYKFRTMYPNSHSLVSLENGNHKIRDDKRITPLGRILRRWDLDELPQILNVILGQMSIVGHRPYYQDEIDVHLKNYPDDRDCINKILEHKPGITGIWQVSGRNNIAFKDRVRLEYDYLNQKSLFSDLGIIFKTPIIILTGKGKIDV